MYYTHRRRYFFIPLILIAMVGFAFITMLLWNALLPVIFHLPQINFWQAAGLLILARLLFGFSGWHGHRHRYFWRERWANMSQEERESFMKRWHCGPVESGSGEEEKQ